ncbi:MAG: hypothetical protein AAGI53_06660 [Planctomycetota bacterium]
MRSIAIVVCVDCAASVVVAGPVGFDDEVVTDRVHPAAMDANLPVGVVCDRLGNLSVGEADGVAAFIGFPARWAQALRSDALTACVAFFVELADGVAMIALLDERVVSHEIVTNPIPRDASSWFGGSSGNTPEELSVSMLAP